MKRNFIAAVGFCAAVALAAALPAAAQNTVSAPVGFTRITLPPGVYVPASMPFVPFDETRYRKLIPTITYTSGDKHTCSKKQNSFLKSASVQCTQVLDVANGKVEDHSF